MSAVFDALKRDALNREEVGFTTTRARYLGLSLEDDPWLTAKGTIVGSAVSPGDVFVGYAARVARDWPNWGAGFSLGDASLVRSDAYFVQMQNEASTMGSGSVLFIDIGSNQRGIVALDMPRNKIYSEEVAFYTANLKRKTPTAIIGGRDYGEENA